MLATREGETYSTSQIFRSEVINMMFNICNAISERIEIPGDVSMELGELLCRGYDIRNIIISIPDEIPYMTFEGLTMTRTLMNTNEAIIVMEEI